MDGGEEGEEEPNVLMPKPNKIMARCGELRVLRERGGEPVWRCCFLIRRLEKQEC